MFDFQSNVDQLNKQIETNSKAQQKLSQSLQQNVQADEMDISADIENAQLSEVDSFQKELNENIVNLIMGLDDVTSSFGAQFEAMKSKTWQEGLVGFFNKSKAESMRADRIREASIQDNLNNLIYQTEQIDTLLSNHLTVLEQEFEKGKSNLEYVVNDYQATTVELEATKSKLVDLDPKIMALETELEQATNAKDRARIESEIMDLTNEINELKNTEARLLAKSQSRERHIKTNQTHIDSLANQIAAQQVLIEIRIDNEQRVITYAQYEQSIKTSEQQEVAHKINDIGSETDIQCQTGMAQIGAATSNRLMQMMERHGSDVNRQNEIIEKKKKADERFMRRFQEVASQHDSAQYTS